MNKCEQMKLN